MYRLFFAFVTGFIVSVAYGAEKLNYPVSQIPDSLKENAYSIVRYESTNFDYLDEENGLQKVVRVVTVLDEKGEGAAQFDESTGKFWELKSFAGEIYDQNGKQIKKIKLSDLVTSTFSEEWASDEVRNVYHYSNPIYPYTVKYEYDIKFKNGIIRFPAFAPLVDFNQSLQQAKYTLSIPAGVKFSSDAKNLPQFVKQSNNEKDVYTWEVAGRKAIDSEPYMTNLDTVIPILNLKPDDFVYERSKGTMCTWADLGRWEWSLVKDRDELPVAAVDKLKAMVANLPSDREKIKKLYEYLQSTTRYVSIQLGIGGYQPAIAADVYKTGFGDCKGLTNYMKAMLKAVGINSYFTIIHLGGEKGFNRKYPSPSQSNHVILTVPVSGDTIPLECTSKHMPFGYVHADIAGHDALMVTPDDGRLIKLKAYPDSVSFVHKRLNLTLDKNGVLQAAVKAAYEMSEYEDMLAFEKQMDNEERIKDIKADYSLPSMTITNVSCVERHDEKPGMDVKYNLQSETYATKSGSRFFCPVNPLRNRMKLFSKRIRKYPFVFGSGTNECDTIRLSLPDGFTIESRPSDLILQKKFGSFKSTITQQGNNLLVVQHFVINKGTYPASINNELKDFLLATNNAFSAQIVLKSAP
jgi:hypothetical protein